MHPTQRTILSRTRNLLQEHIRLVNVIAKTRLKRPFPNDPLAIGAIVNGRIFHLLLQQLAGPFFFLVVVTKVDHALRITIGASVATTNVATQNLLAVNNTHHVNEGKAGKKCIE